MTATLEPTTTLWSNRPGWGIAADLIPPELINSRQLSLLRKLIAGALVVLLLVCAGGYYLAKRQNSAASDTSATVAARTLQLQKESRQYGNVTRIEGTVAQVQGQVATLMTGDIDLVPLLKSLRTSLPAPMTINQESVTLTPATLAAASAGTGLDTSGLARIGTITVGGSGRALTDLATYVDRLKAVVGLVDVTPVSNTASKGGTQFSLTVGLTSAALSHRFDVGKKAAK